MGYYSSLRGELTFDPPIISGADVAALSDYGYLRVETVKAIVTVGTQTTHTGVAVTTGVEFDVSERKVHNLESEVRAFVSSVDSRNLTTVNGTIEVFGEDSTDIWRLIVENSVVRREEAEVRWPDGSRVDSNY